MWYAHCRANSLKDVKTPTLNFTGGQEVDTSLRDLAIQYYGPVNPDYLQQRAQKYENPSLAIDAARQYFESNKLDQGILCIRDAMRWLDGKEPELSWKQRIAAANVKFSSWAVRKLRPRAPDSYMLSAAHSSVYDPENTWYLGKLGTKVADRFESRERKEMYLVHALLATAQNRSDKEQAWADAIALLLQGNPKRYGESTHPLWTFESPRFANTVLLKGDPRADALEQWRKGAQNLDDILEGEVAYPFPLHTQTQMHEGYHLYPMMVIPGENAYDQFSRQELDALPGIRSLQARIHARYPKLEKMDLYRKMQKKLHSKELKLPKGRAKKTLKHLKPVNQAIKEHAVWVVNLDGHPEQYLVGKRLAIVDTEFTHSHPATLDMANLHAYDDYLTPDQQRIGALTASVTLREEGYRTDNRVLKQAYDDETILMRAYHNSVIHRMISFVSAWSEPTRTRMRSKREAAIARAVRAIDLLKQDDREYYEDHKQDYDQLRVCLNKIREHISYTS